ncbi:hypothetical protein G6F70_007009 [Rhizopus microsporus]|nr:hypothetical protein G6F70_007009 [Rhizopus microsporus]KAG1212890.1 hypothetical protein G6F69_003286 [Rhizopus microsporus]KAG1265341.1 hypothetical protein G6F68_003671 [Rhizopus microsporus]
MEHSPTEYRSSAKGRDLVHSVQLMVDKLEEEYQDQLRRKDKEAFRREQELKLVKYELKEALKRLELPTTVQLAEARKRIRELEDEVFRFENKKIESTDGTDNNGSANDVTSKDKLIKSLQHQLDTSLQTIEQLKQELELVKEREMEYKRLIATCCNTPLEKLDILIKPLTLAIENDPPDLDMTRVIGFMEKLQRRGSVNSNSGTPHDLSSTPTF